MTHASPQRLRRLARIVAEIDGESLPDSKMLATKFGVTRRTIFRDIELLRQLGYRIDYHDPNRRYYRMDSAHHQAQENEPTNAEILKAALEEIIRRVDASDN